MPNQKSEETGKEIKETERRFNHAIAKVKEHFEYFSFPKSLQQQFESFENSFKVEFTRIHQNSAIERTDSMTFAFTQNRNFNTLFENILLEQKRITEQLKSDYSWSLTDNAIIQIILLITSIPILITDSNKLKKEEKERKSLLNSLHENNQKYLYHSETNYQEEAIINSISAYQKIFRFVDLVSVSNYDAAQTLITEQDKVKNENTIIGKLIYMSEQLELNEKDKQQKQWVANGLNEFNNILRSQAGHLESLYDSSIRYLCQYSGSLQGYLFVKTKMQEEDVLELKACFAYNKKKWIHKIIGLQEGLSGQALQEGEYIYLKEIPQKYTTITSGLGESTPGTMIILPGIHNNEKELVVEFASFNEYTPYAIEFLTKAIQSLTATIQAEKNTTRMQELVHKSLQQAEALREQEEEIRQNMEELEATNETIRRREEELLRNLKVTRP